MSNGGVDFSDPQSAANVEQLAGAAADSAAEDNVATECDPGLASTSDVIGPEEIVAVCDESCAPVPSSDAVSPEDEELARAIKESEEQARLDEERRRETDAREAEEAEQVLRLSADEARAAEAEALARAEADLQAALEASKETACARDPEAEFQTAIELSKMESHVSTQAAEFVVEWATPSKCKMASHELDMSMDPSLLIFGAAGNFLNAAKAGSSSSGGEISRGF